MILTAIAIFNLLGLGMAEAAKDGDAAVPSTSPSGVVTSEDRERAALWFVVLVAMFPSVVFGAAYLLLVWLFPSMGGA